MPRERTLTKLKLTPASVSGLPGRVHARWERSDGSKGSIVVYFRLKKAARWYIARLLIDEPTAALLRDVPLARIEAAANADPKIREWMEKSADEETITLARQAASQRPRLKRPARSGLDDDFYKRVAAAYRGAVAHGLPPAKTLAADSDTPPGTVNRWIAEARERFHLPEGEPGKVTAHVIETPAPGGATAGGFAPREEIGERDDG